ncbi:lipopolysaccharide biosynthesis protein [Phocaeicola oris]|uniref:lipopolysaccharide biosynthesis protein n=1 Tax=Phocaeicola oris TaxID=2896850 RepID=UPI00234E6C8E|nr:lipopolysaccharide biosynthesis protein [Phocaeicola oris]MCE2615605.1 lipopolysaccharide biosynthesis protein [Phocaeicola oris]
MSDSLKKKTATGLIWSSLERFSVQGVQFLVMIIMARILTPYDYGIIGMLTIFLQISQSLIDSGFSQALIRKQNRTEVDNFTVFYFNIVVSIVLYITLFISAPWIAKFYHTPILIPVMRVICLGIVINSFVVVQRALFTIKIDFKTQAKASLFAAILSGIVGIGMAYKGYGVWSLVAQQLVNYGGIALLLWYFSKWRPKWVYSWKSFKELFSFGSKLMISGLLNTTYNNIYLIVIGRLFTATNLGHYTRAHQFADFPSSNITGILQRVTYPVLCTIQNDDKRLSDVYRKLLKLSAYIIFPMMCGLAAVAHPFIILLLGEKWEFCSIILQILCFSMMWYPIHAINLNLLQVKGRSDLFLKLEIIKKIIGIAILCITIPIGLIAMCYGQIVSSIIALIINTYYTGKLIQVGFIKQMKDISGTLVLSLLMFITVIISIPYISDSLIKLIFGTTLGAIFFIGISKIMKFQEFNYIVSIIKKNNG